MTEIRDKLLKWLFASVEKYFLPLLLGAVVMNTIFDTYFYSLKGIATVGFIAYEVFMFWFFEKIKKRRILRFFIYCGIGLPIMMLTFWLVGSGWQRSGVSFVDWFYINSQDVGAVMEYNIAIFVGLGFFIISILYYFTVYRFRIFGVMLVTMFPFVIYGKRSENISTLTITFMMTIFLAMMVHQRLVSDDAKDEKNKVLMINHSYTIGIALFVTFVGAVTMLIPKPAFKSQLELNQGIFRFTINTNSTDYDDLNDVSSPRFGADSTGEILFTVRPSEFISQVYLRRQSFDYFRSEQWVLRDEFQQWQGIEEGEDNEINSPVYVHRLMKALAETGRYESYGLTPDLFDKHEEYDSRVILNISGSNYSPTYIPAPLMANVEPLNYCVRNVHGEVYYAGGFTSRYGGLGLSYSYYPEAQEEYDYAYSLPFNWPGFLRLMDEAMNNGDITTDQYSNLVRMYTLYTEKGGVTDRITDLAHEITDSYDSDMAKCTAIVNYFMDNGYIYDLDYIPDDESIEYFLFESKTGVCTSYATSMVLMARALGIPARYVEGFAAYERNEEGLLVVRDSHAHAFVEVYVAGAGWVTFDPTVPDYKQQEEYGNGNAADTLRTFLDYFSRIALFLGVLFVLIFVVFLDRIIELFFRIRMKFRKTTPEKTLALYRRILRLLEVSSDKNALIRGMTPQQVLALSYERGAEIGRAVSLFEQVCFGGYTPAEVEFEAAYSLYKQSWKALAGKLKKEKAKAQSPAE
ncbi:transglutaminase domain-containing protein [Ruminococcus sp.]|uniref:transglutaminase domain-containing protein n=1 Tax=Ruminococcus sp. TaxID=41978 RepID=UPI0025E6D1AE|nr:transglutaminase domain-containing protein [Ruminococcus sp.]MBQ8966244.1 transglutaminase [Ruminococcus sp.]